MRRCKRNVSFNSFEKPTTKQNIISESIYNQISQLAAYTHTLAEHSNQLLTTRGSCRVGLKHVVDLISIRRMQPGWDSSSSQGTIHNQGQFHAANSPTRRRKAENAAETHKQIARSCKNLTITCSNKQLRCIHAILYAEPPWRSFLSYPSFNTQPLVPDISLIVKADRYAPLSSHPNLGNAMTSIARFLEQKVHRMSLNTSPENLQETLILFMALCTQPPCDTFANISLPTSFYSYGTAF